MQALPLHELACSIFMIDLKLSFEFSVFDPDPYHLAGSGSTSGNVEMDPGSKK